MSRKPLFVLGATALLLILSASAYAGPGCKNKPGIAGYFTDQSILSGGLAREYNLYVHPRYKSSRPTPLVFLFHGFGQSAENIEWYSNMTALADVYKFILVIPKGTLGPAPAYPPNWNDGSGFTPAWAAGVDDVTFVADLIDEISWDYCINPARVYATGLSNGAAMSYHLSCELSELIAAIGPVAGPDGSVVLNQECTPSRPVPVIAFNGTADIFIPWFGGAGFWPGVTYPTVPDMMDEVAYRNGCSDETEVVYEKGDVTCIAYQDCDTAAVQHCAIDGGGHNWPGAADLCALSPSTCWWSGYTTEDIDASREIWKFFAEHVMNDD